MTNEVERMLTAGMVILSGIIGVAVLAVIVSGQSDTSGVIGAGSKGFACTLLTALSPITGGAAKNMCGGSSVLGTAIPPSRPPRGTADSSVTFCMPGQVLNQTTGQCE